FDWCCTTQIKPAIFPEKNRWFINLIGVSLLLNICVSSFEGNRNSVCHFGISVWTDSVITSELAIVSTVVIVGSSVGLNEYCAVSSDGPMNSEKEINISNIMLNTHFFIVNRPPSFEFHVIIF